MPGKHTAVFTFILVMALFVLVADGYGEAVFGPQDFTISRWHTHLSRHTFALESGGDGVIEISKNTPQQEIRGGFIYFNQDLISLRRFLIGDELTFEKDVRLKSTNHILVFARGTPGASVTLAIKHKGSLAPEIIVWQVAPHSL